MPERPGGKQMGTTSTGGLDSGANYGNTGKDYGPYSKGPPHQPKGKTTTGDGVKTAATVYSAIKHPVVTAAKWVGKNIFQNKAKTPTVEDTAAMEDHHLHQQRKTYDFGPTGGDGIATLRNTGVTHSLASTPTADVNTRHQWGFQAYPGTPGTTYDPKTYAKQGKMIGKYGTGQEIKNFSKGKRFGPPPLKGPDPQGLQTVLESSDYFKKLIG